MAGGKGSLLDALTDFSEFQERVVRDKQAALLLQELRRLTPRSPETESHAADRWQRVDRKESTEIFSEDEHLLYPNYGTKHQRPQLFVEAATQLVFGE